METVPVSVEALATMKKLVEKLDADNKMLLEALQWYVDNDDTDSDYVQNGYFLDGKAKAEFAIQQATKEPTAVFE